MKGFLSLVMRGRAQAIAFAALCLLLPPFGILSGAIVGLATLRYGGADGALVLAGSVALAAAVSVVLFQAADHVMLYTVLTGVPVLVLAVVLRFSASQGAVLAAGAAVAGAFMTFVHLLASDPVGWWRGLLGDFVLGRMEARDTALTPEQIAAVNDLLDKAAPLMPSLPAGVMVSAVVTLYLARWWHATLDNPGGFGKEFRALRLDRRIGFAALLAGVWAGFAPRLAGGLGVELFNLMVAVFMIQGIALVHSLVRQRSASHGWLVALYMLLVLFPPPMVMLLAVGGLSDTWIDYRARWGAT